MGHYPEQASREEPTAGLPGTTPEGELGAEDEPATETISVEGEPSSSSTSRPSTGPHQQQRERRVWTDTSAGGEHKDDLSKFEVHTIMRSLRRTTAAGKRRILQQLHIRWWHATVAQMKNVTLLKRANYAVHGVGHFQQA